MTKPIIFTYLLLPASRHVILNGLIDPRAGFEPLENMVSQMKLSQRRLVAAFSLAFLLSLIRASLCKLYKILIFSKRKNKEASKLFYFSM